MVFLVSMLVCWSLNTLLHNALFREIFFCSPDIFFELDYQNGFTVEQEQIQPLVFQQPTPFKP